jgi:predicted Zn-dependent protease
MRPLVRNILLLTILILFAQGCTNVPITGRRQLNIVPDSTIEKMAAQEYDSFVQQNKVSANSSQTAMVKTVGSRVASAVERWARANNYSDKVSGYKWEFTLIDDPSLNAWAMPGGKIVVYTGLMNIISESAELATVMSHEVAHVVAGHGNERMSQGLIVNLGGMGLSAALSKKPDETANLFMKAYSVGTQYGVLLPYSRVHETEADRLGLIFMSMAGYNPNAAVGFWQKMSAASTGSKPPELLSTHPSDKTRIANIQRAIPEAMTYYQK